MRWLLRVSILLFSLGLTGFDSCSGPQAPQLPAATGGGGFIIETGFEDNGVPSTAPSTQTNWVWKQDLSNPLGDPTSFASYTNALSLDTSDNGRVSAEWTVTWVYNSDFFHLDCNGKSGVIPVDHRGQLVGVTCYTVGEEIGGDAAFSVSPSPLNPVSMPGTITVSGSGFDPTYGMPVIQYFDMNGDLVAQQAASSVSADRTTISLIPPPVTEMNAGIYAGVLNNVNSDGSYAYLGMTSVEVSLPMYRPTQYSDWGTTYPGQYTQTSTPDGPINGTAQPGYTTTVSAYDDWEVVDEEGDLGDVSSESGECTWSGFPSHVDSNALTLYIPYSISFNGPSDALSFNGGYYTIAATVNGTQTTLYAQAIDYDAGVLTAPVPAGTDLSTIQVTVSDDPDNRQPDGLTGGYQDFISLDAYVQ